ncbi:bifunctional biotin--[acetyl-CoA-carboxylase] ligase/biotin operon repressor BirA [Streptococcus parauberis]|uniref:bifunctional biotin--[acetyl-CoA-carboxylase] ligase/biotin operon repressor BirA n=1 Tax=Streptococcus parauberis TaxID=1348 RepID=UPI000CCF93E8|nr:bifunctional biotin--[acetyl-CoA-carboxylase] ligase/biotin operon repressor BirA [Streptococcus parauberis]PNY20093.1 Bifunctional ligase/repressor BirA [Streptococcus parauberis]
MKTSEKLYQILSQSESFISGEKLADQLSLSRTAIWKGIKSLENQGIEILATKKEGYKIISGDLLSAQEISNKLNISVTLNESSLSTQLDAKNAIATNPSAPHLYLSPSQKQAKGRLGRDFYASKNGGIYMSLHLKPNQTYQEMEPYTMMVASSIVNAIYRLTGIETQIKWVNDIYLNDKKIAGILTEAITSVETGLITDVIIGAGLNFHLTDLPEELSSIATSLFRHQPTITRNQLISEIWKLFFQIPVQDHLKVYKEKSLVLNKQVTYSKNNQIIHGRAIDITDQGYLIVEKTDKTLETLHSGEISLSSWTL